MYTAIIKYKFKQDYFEEACKIWEDEVLEIAEKQPGFVRMQFFTNNNNEALAIGNWKSIENAQAFMRTGIFVRLLEKLSDMLVEKPSPQTWELCCFAQAK